MKILLVFSLFKNEKKEVCLPFWSCALDTSIDKDIVNYEYLNRENEYKIENSDPLWLRMCYFEYSEENIKKITGKHQKRPGYFVALDKTFLTGSPYKDSSSLVHTYYQDTMQFIQELREFCGFDSDYKLNLLQRNTIKLINKLIGIDILKNESTPGALSIYDRLPAFHVMGNFNASKGERNIIISAQDDLSAYNDLLIQMEIIDSDKILYNSLQNLSFGFKYILPETNNLENFSQFHISVLGKKNDSDIITKIYEGKFHLMCSFNFGISVSGGYSKIVHNRYQNKQIDKIEIYDHINNISSNPEDFFDLEFNYKSLLVGKDKKYLESEYFSNTPDGRNAFLNWIRKILHDAKIVKIVDAYFDNLGLNDLSNCCNSRFQLNIVTTDPKKRKNSANLLKNISIVFPDSKIFYSSKFHDRYLYVDDSKEQKLFSISNSWNGTVNNSSMYIQEVPLITALQIYDEINSYTIDENQQKLPVVNAPKKIKTNGRKKYSKTDITLFFQNLTSITAVSDNDEIVFLTSWLFWASYYGKTNKEQVSTEIKKCFGRLPEEKIENIIDIIIIKLLTEQKKSFENEDTFISGEIFTAYDNPRKCLERFSNMNIWGEPRYYRLNLDYGLSELLYICFCIKPVYVIEYLQTHEEEICKQIVHANDISLLRYYVSEYIIQSFLIEFYPFHGKLPEETWNFLEKTDCLKYIYIRMFFALSIIDETLNQTNEGNFNFSDIIQLFTRLKLSQAEIAVVLGKAFNSIAWQNRASNEALIYYQKEITSFIAENLDEQSIIIFSLLAFIEPYDLRPHDFISFVKTLEDLNKTKQAEILEKLFLLYALRTNQKLQKNVSVLLGIDQKVIDEYIVKKEQVENEPSDVDVRKFIPVLPYMGMIFAYYLGKSHDTTAFKKIVFSLKIDKAMIFNTKFPEKLTLFYYDLLFLLNTINKLNTINETQDLTLGRQAIIDFTQWYLPVCIDNLPNDFYGLGLKIIVLYAEMISEGNKEKLLQRITYIPMKALIASKIKKQSIQTIETYKEYIKQYNIDGHDISISAENYLVIGISLCIRCAEECNNDKKDDILKCIMQINKKLKPVVNDTMKQILNYGIEYAKTLSVERKNIFFNIIKENPMPYLFDGILENYNV
jgi:hypothetical protein